ncbi:MAG: hypothetical protein K2K82_08715 [Muribaculaceae bacterium]|nr:hypothetical protein [Muribaculaceae bacterium]
MSIFKNKPIERVEVGGFVAEWYFKENNIKESYLEISTVSGIWSMRVDARCNAYDYLLESARQGKVENIHGYAALLYITAQQLTQEQGFCDDITRSAQKWQRRMEKKAEKAAKAVTEHEELASQSLMEDVARYADAKNDKERKKMREQWKEDAREALREDKV